MLTLPKRRDNTLAVAGYLAAAIIMILISFLVFSALHNNNAHADDPTLTNESFFTFDSGTGTITDYDGTNGPKDVVIPSTIGGVDVVTIGDGSFASKALTSVILPNSITSIGIGAFAYNSVSAIVIPNSVTSIKDGAFSDNNITSLIIPDSVVSIGDGSFQNNPLSSLDLGQGVTIIGSGSFSNDNLTSLTIPSSLKEIQYSAFDGNSISSLDLGSGIETIRSGAFSNNQLASLTIPDSVTTLEAAFNGNPLTSIVIGSENYTGAPSLTIPPNAFSTMTLQSVKIGNTVKEIGYGAFADNSITSLSLGGGVEAIRGNAFDNNQLTSVTIPDSVITLEGAFNGNPLASIVIGSKSYSGAAHMVVASSAFYNQNLTSVTIGNSVKEIQSSAFSDNQISALDLGEGLEIIGSGAFSNNQITSLIIPDSMTLLESGGAFDGNSIETLTIGSTGYTGAPHLVIGDAAFYGIGLKHVLIGKVVQSIGEAAFYGNPLLTITTWSDVPVTSFSFHNSSAVTQAPTDQYIRLFTGDPNNPYGYTDTLERSDVNNDSSNVVLGYIVNPAQLSIKHLNSHSDEISSVTTTVGPNLGDYLISSNPGADFTKYYRIGDQVPITLPDIIGYVTPAGSTVSLANGEVVQSFVYLTPAEVEAVEKAKEQQDSSGNVNSHTTTPGVSQNSQNSSLIQTTDADEQDTNEKSTDSQNTTYQQTLTNDNTKSEGSNKQEPSGGGIFWWITSGVIVIVAAVAGTMVYRQRQV